MPQHTFTFMGTAAGCGVPSFFCDCPACEEARANPALRRGDCGVMVRGQADEAGRVPTLVIDTPPDARHQLLREDVRRVDEILFTHAHFDHIGGLGEYEYLVQLIQKRTMPVFGSATALSGIAGEFHYMTYCMDLHAMEPFDVHEFDGVRYTACPVTHAPGTYGYLIETPGDEAAGTPGTRVFYASDTARLPEKTAERVRGCDVLAMDATFWKRNWSPDDHHSVQECVEEGLALGAKKIYLTHMCMHYDEPITYAELSRWLEQYEGRAEAALDGMTFAI
ncbi:MBL fold metallo-hydrolase [Adlercreutzia sp. ZJ473]|uniref:MBL fold metallo-hydrolase n=1 Tax=Adlercreutzia sp. ZJ473 TaxID=2722822 RepID=UPI001553FE2D|nr:MBL fold metallo-hydrolase [Adlercreutzia sp. ZJ473]